MNQVVVMVVRSAGNGGQRYGKCLGHVPSVPCVRQVHVCVFVSDALSVSHHAGSAPDVCWGAVTCSNQDLDGAVLSRLDVFSKVLMLDNRDKT